MRKLFLVSALVISTHTLLLSQKLTGRVVDINQSPIEDAQVVLQLNDSLLNSSFTDRNGAFSIAYNTNNFDVVVYCLGYKQNRAFIVNARGNVRMEEVILLKDSVELDEVLVKAESIINYGNRTLVFPNKRDVESSQNVLELFQKSNFPGLSANLVAQSLSIDGKTNITYRINGINASLQEIVALSPGQISHVEYQRIAADIRDIESVGVMNVFLKKSTGTFLSTSKTGAVTTGFINGNLNLTSGYTNSNITLNYGVNWRDYNRYTSYENENYFYPDENLNFEKIGNESPFGYLQQNINLGYTYHNDYNTFNAKFLNNINSSHDRSDITLYNNINSEYVSNRYTSSESQLYIPALDLYYIHTIDGQKRIEMNLVGSLATSNYLRNTLEHYPSNTDSINTRLDGSSKSLAYELFYSQNTEKFNYNIGAKVSYVELWNKAIYTEEKDDMSRLDIYPYISFNGKLSFLNYNAGTGLKILKNETDLLSKTYIRNLTNLSLYYVHKNLSLQYALRYMPNYPQLSNMTAIVQQQDPYMFISGNPSLKTSQQLTNNLEFSYNHKIFSTSLSLYSVHEYDPIREIVSFENNRYISRFENIDKEKNYGMYFYTFIPSIFNMFKFRFNAGVNYYKSILDHTRYNSLTNIHYSTQIEYFYKSFTLGFGWTKPRKTLSGEVITRGENNSFINLIYANKNLTIGAALYYPFSAGAEYKSNRISDIYYSKRDVLIKDNSNMFVIAVVYTVNWGKSLFNIRRNLNNVEFNNPIMTKSN
jgi:hypothetical protein